MKKHLFFGLILFVASCKTQSEVQFSKKKLYFLKLRAKDVIYTPTVVAIVMNCFCQKNTPHPSGIKTSIGCKNVLKSPMRKKD